MYMLLFSFLGCLLFLVSVGLIVYVFISRRKADATRASAVFAEGKVTELVMHSRYREFGTSSAGVYRPVVEFQVNGQIYHFESAFGSRPAPNKVGDTVKVRYDPANPQNAEVDSVLSNNLGTIIAVIFAIVLFCIGGTFLAISLGSYASGLRF